MLYLQEAAKQGAQHQRVTLTQRLPEFVNPPCLVQADYEVQAETDFYLIRLTTTAELQLICQRCGTEFPYHYHNQTSIAVCKDEERAAELMEDYESVVSSGWQVSLEDLITDELYLYAPRFHPESEDCDKLVNAILSQNS